ncbi:MAG: hypothetical protein ACFN23_03955, partial [Capnocytophaga gingivalis]
MLWVPIVKTPKSQNAKNNQAKDIQDIKQYLKVHNNIIFFKSPSEFNTIGNIYMPEMIDCKRNIISDN